MGLFENGLCVGWSFTGGQTDAMIIFFNELTFDGL